MEIVVGTPKEEIISRRGFLKRMIGLSGSGKDESLLDTARLAGMATLVLMATIPVAEKIQETTKIGIRNRGDLEKDDFTKKGNPGSRFLMLSVITPVIEEGLFRFLPSILFPKRLGALWKVGVPTSAGFAAIHNYNRDEKTREWKMYTDTIPIYQFGLGLLLWKIMRERGYLHAIVAHSVVNTIAGLLDYLPFAPPTQPGKPSKTKESANREILAGDSYSTIQQNFIRPEALPPY